MKNTANSCTVNDAFTDAKMYDILELDAGVFELKNEMDGFTGEPKYEACLMIWHSITIRGA